MSNSLNKSFIVLITGFNFLKPNINKQPERKKKRGKVRMGHKQKKRTNTLTQSRKPNGFVWPPAMMVA